MVGHPVLAQNILELARSSSPLLEGLDLSFVNYQTSLPDDGNMRTGLLLRAFVDTNAILDTIKLLHIEQSTWVFAVISNQSSYQLNVNVYHSLY